MTSLRQRLLEDMPIRKLSPLTHRAYVEHVSRFARHVDRSPVVLGAEEIRAYQVYLTNDQPLAPAAIGIAVAARRGAAAPRSRSRRRGRLTPCVPHRQRHRPCRWCSVPQQWCTFSTP